MSLARVGRLERSRVLIHGRVATYTIGRDEYCLHGRIFGNKCGRAHTLGCMGYIRVLHVSRIYYDRFWLSFASSTAVGAALELLEAGLNYSLNYSDLKY